MINDLRKFSWATSAIFVVISMLGFFSTPAAPGLFLIELFLPWIEKIMFAYQEQKELENDLFNPKGIKYSNAYYTKKVN